MKALHLLVFLIITLFLGFSDIDSQTNQDITEIEWSNDGSKLAIGYRDGTFRIFRSNDMAILFEQLTIDNSISSLAWSPSGTKLAIGYFLDRVDIWDTVSFQKVLTLSIPQNNRLMWGEDNNTLFVGDGAEVPTLKYDTNTGMILDTYSPVYSYLIPLTNSDIFVSHWFSAIFFINSDTMLVVDEFNFDDEFGRIFVIQVSPDEDFIAIGTDDNTIHILDIQSREIIMVLNGGQEVERRVGITDLAFNETGSRLFTATQSGTIRSWDTSTWQIIESIEVDTFIADFSPDARQLAYDNWQQESELLIQDLCDFVAPDVTTLLNIMPQANTFGEEAQICLTENATYTLSASLPDITGDITLIGNGAQIVMTGGSRIFNVTIAGGLHLKNVTLSGGVADDGGAIYNAGDLTLDNVTLENNTAQNGGAIYNAGNLTMTNGALLNNTATLLGGAIYNAGPRMDLDGVRIEDNNAPEGSGVYQAP